MPVLVVDFFFPVAVVVVLEVTPARGDFLADAPSPMASGGVSVVGSEEIYPMLADVRPLARLTGFPYFPLTPTWPWLGPLGLIPLPSKWRIEFHPPIRTDELPPESADDPSVVMRVADEVRDVIQQGVVRNLMLRRRAFRG